MDDQEMVRRGLSLRLGIEPDLEVVGETEYGAGAVDGAVAHVPDVVLMDVRRASADGAEATAGAAGLVGKHQPEGDLTEEIRRAARGRGS